VKTASLSSNIIRLPCRTDKENTRFLSSVAAFANTSGGTIVFDHPDTVIAIAFGDSDFDVFSPARQVLDRGDYISKEGACGSRTCSGMPEVISSSGSRRSGCLSALRASRTRPMRFRRDR
jgi:hypothetical protein